MVTALLGALALAGPADFSLQTRYASAFGPDAWGTVHLRAEAATDLHLGALAIGGTRSALLATAARTLRLGDRLTWTGELQAGMRRTTVDEEGGPLAGFESALSVRAADPVDAALAGGWLPGIGGWFGAGVDAHSSDRLTLHPRLRAGTWAGDRDLALRVELGLSHRWRSGWFLRGDLGAGGRDTVHLGPSVALSFGRST